MTDKEKLEALLTEFGVQFEHEMFDWGESVRCREGMRKVTGYTGFVSVFDFNKDGKFIQMGAWE